MAVVANNLANVNTTGYKETRGVFQDLYYQNVRQVGGSTTQDTLAPTGLNLGTGVQMVSTEKLYTQGSVNQTGNSLDLAINGRGFFQVLMPDGTLAYTRDGSFQTNATGQVVTASGYVLQPAITIPSGAQSITIGSDGTVSVLLAGQTAPSTVGTLQLADFVNEAGLQPYGQNLLLPSAASGTGDNRNLTTMAGLLDQSLIGGTTSINSAVNELVTNIGIQTSQSQSGTTAQQAVLTDASNAQQSVSGVNLDEEAANLVQYQQAYQAAAQVINVSSTLFQSLLTAVQSSVQA